MDPSMHAYRQLPDLPSDRIQADCYAVDRGLSGYMDQPYRTDRLAYCQTIAGAEHA